MPPASGRTAIAVGDTEEIFHLVNVKVGHAPSFDFPRCAELFETRYDVGELGIWHWPVQQIEIEKAGAEARETGLASTRHPVSRHFVGFHFGDQEYTVTLASDRATNQFLGAPVGRRNYMADR